MNYQDKALVCAHIAQIRNEEWQCGCNSCKKAKAEGYVPHSMTLRDELIALIVETGEDNLTEANGRVGRMSDEQVIVLLPKKRARLATQLEIEKLTRKSPSDPTLNSSPIQVTHESRQTRGGKRRVTSTRNA